MFIKQSVVMTAGTIINSLLGLVFYVLVGRSLSISSFGYFSFLLGIGVMFSELGDFGIGSTIVKFAHGDKFKPIITIAFIERVLVGILIFGLAAIGQLIYPANFLLSALVALSSLFVYIILQTFIARQDYASYVGINILGNLSRLAIVFVLVKTSLFSAETGIGAFVLANTLAFGVGLLIIGLPLTRFSLKETMKEIFPYGAWAGLSFSVASLAAKIDNPLVYFFAGAVPAGIYASSQRLSSILPQVNASIEGVFSPKLARDRNFKPFMNYLFLSILASVALILVIPFSGLIITFLFGQKYAGAINVFQLILFGMIFVFLSGPFSSSVLYKFGKSNWHFFSSGCQLILSVILYWLFVPKYGAVGAAVVFIIVQLVNLLLFVGIYVKNNHSYNS